MSLDADRRALAAVRFVDLATGAMIADPLTLESEGRWTQNRTGDWVLREHPALPGYDTSFATPTGLPDVGSIRVRVVVRDPARRWVPRAFRVPLPRLPHHGTHDLYARIEVPLGPGPAVPLRQSWGALRLHVRFAPGPETPEGVPIEGALVRVTTDAGELRAMTLTDARGEATAPVPRIPLYAPGDGTGPVLEPRIPHRLHVVVDRGATDPSTGRRAQVADPDELWFRRASLTRGGGTALLSVGREITRVVDIPA